MFDLKSIFKGWVIVFPNGQIYQEYFKTFKNAEEKLNFLNSVFEDRFYNCRLEYRDDSSDIDYQALVKNLKHYVEGFD